VECAGRPATVDEDFAFMVKGHHVLGDSSDGPLYDTASLPLHGEGTVHGRPPLGTHGAAEPQAIALP
jgi:hypothetical protein